MAISIVSNGQNTPVNRADYRLQAMETDQTFKIDGILDEEVWSKAEKTSPFFRITPIDTGYAIAQTEVMVAYDDAFIYMGIICYDPSPGRRPAESYRRDWSFNRNDNFFAAIDTYNDQTNGFAFGVNAVGGQWDGMQSNGGKVANDWDGKWYSAVQNYEDRWVAEFKIPFRTIRFHEGDTEWGINFSRLDLKTNEKSAWAPVPRQFASATLAFTGTLAMESPLPKSGVRFSLIPYVSGKATKDSESGNPTAYKANAGLDAKVILSTSMNMDVTINPDYSQVEVDRQVTNLDRFEIFFPEKRKFFLENSDLFANLGDQNLRPFFSRRIGLNQPVIAGARLSGSAGENWRIGLMDMQTAATDEYSADNFSVAVLQRKVLSRSNVGAFLTNKQVISSPNDSTSYYDYNRVAGGEFNFASADNNWTGKAFYHYSFNPGEEGNRFATSAMVAYNTETFSAGWNQAYVGANYLAEMGYVRRNAYHQSNPSVGYKFYTMSERIVSHGPELEADFLWDPSFNMTDREVELGYSLTWRDRSSITLGLENAYVKLLEPFDPTHTGGVEIPAGSEFNENEVSLMYMSTMKRLFTFMAGTRYGGYFGGTRTSLEAEINYRVQPYGSLSLVASYNKVLMPDPYTSADLVLVGP
ncbi:MAG: hydrolase, partial [Bacteroidetes bacterium]